MAEMVFSLLAGAGGSALGGLAGQAVFGKPPNLAADTSIDGVKNAVVRPASKGTNNALNVAQVDDTQSIAWLDQGVNSQLEQYGQGLKYYTSALQKAAIPIQTGYMNANAQLAPMSQASNMAMSRYMQMLGMTPPQMTSSAPQLLQNALGNTFGTGDTGLNLGNIVGGQASYDRLNDMLAAANSAKDENSRQLMLKQIQDYTRGGATANTLQDLQSKLRNVKSTLDGFQAPTWADYQNSDRPDKVYMQYLDSIGGDQYALDRGNYNLDVEKKMEQGDFQNYINVKKDEWNNATAQNIQSQKAAIQAQIDQVNKYGSVLKNFGQTFGQNYSTDYAGAFDKDQITAALTATPGYQFEVDQGTKAVTRQAASLGNVLSGNTALALQDFGQSTAMNYYDKYMNNLANIMSQGSSASLGLAANQVNEGSDLANLITQAGQAGYQTYNAMGDAYNNAQVNKAQTYNQIATYNATAQNQAMAAERGKQADMEKAAMGAGASMSNAATGAAANNSAASLAWTKFNYGVAQNQQAAKAYYG